MLLYQRRLLVLCALLMVPPAYAQECSDPPSTPGISAFCGVEAPEDIVVFDGRVLLISSMGPSQELYGFAPDTEQLAALATRMQPLDASKNWGDPECPLPEGMVTHGLDLSRRVSGEWQLLAVNHGERESVEFFEVLPRDGALPALAWRGCVMARDNAQFNDVAALPDGGFLATDPITASMQLPRMLLGALGMETGQVYRWRPEAGYAPVPNTAGAYPNGILLSADGDSFYLNLYLDGEVREHELETGEVLNRVAVDKPDNSSLAPDGRLLVASHDASIFTLLAAVTSKAGERNTIPYSIVAIDPASFEATTLFASDGSEMGGGTVAQMLGDDLFIGAFRGDRLIRVR